jgi:ribulose-5-phosphate 4-epimerase/fuculose-1-phosphate aldolase
MAHTLMNKPVTDISRELALQSTAAIQTRIELAACFRLAARFGYAEGVCNHFSAVVPGHDDLMFINPFGYAFEEITASRLLVCDFDGNVLAGDGAPEATAFFIHARLHRLKPRIKVALHTHMPNATALSMLEGQPLLWAGQTALKFYGRIAVDEQYNGLALDESEGDRIAQAMGDADVVFLKNHGVMVAGPNVAEAWDDLYYLERAAEVQLKAMSAGRPMKSVSPGVAQRTFEQMRAGDPASARAHLNSMMRVLKNEGVPFDR